MAATACTFAYTDAEQTLTGPWAIESVQFEIRCRTEAATPAPSVTHTRASTKAGVGSAPTGDVLIAQEQVAAFGLDDRQPSDMTDDAPPPRSPHPGVAGGMPIGRRKCDLPDAQLSFALDDGSGHKTPNL